MPSPFPPGTGYGLIKPSPAPAPGAGGAGSIPANDLVGPANDNWGDMSWMPPPPKDTGTAKFVKHVFGRAAFGYGMYRRLQENWNDFSRELRLPEYLALIPFGAMGLNPAFWTKLCDTGALCAPSGPVPWFAQWSADGPTCTALCSIPTVTVSNASLTGTQPYLIKAYNLDRTMEYGSACPATLTLHYFRTKQRWQAVATAPDGFHLHSRIKKNPGILLGGFPSLANGWAGQAYPPGVSPWPNVFPDLVPVGVPVMPAALPFRLPRVYGDPAQDPLQQPRKWPRPATAPRPAEAPYSPTPGLEVHPNPDAPPDIVLVPEIVAGPRSSPRRSYKPYGRTRSGLKKGSVRHQFKKPGKGVRERKPKDTKLYKAAKALVNGVTETADVVDAAWNALDLYHANGSPMHGANGWQTRVKGKKTSYVQKVKDIYNAFGDPRFDEGAFARDFAIGLAKNEAGDRVGGAIGKQTRKANKKSPPRKGLNLGFAFGPAL